jgi:hypothetical protein
VRPAGRTNEKPPAAFAGGGLGAANCLLVGQASFPARELGLQIRMAGIGAPMAGTEMKHEKHELTPKECMT